MRRLLAPVAVLAVLVLALGGAAAATDGSAKPRKPVKIAFLDVADEFEFVDVGAAGQSPGDLFVFENDLRNRADTRTIGRFLATCTALVTPGLASCRGTIQLEGGNVEVATAIDFNAGGPILAAVTGGTERYRFVRGQLRLSEETSPGVREGTLELRLR